MNDLDDDVTILPLSALLAPRMIGEVLCLALDHVVFLVLADVVIARDAASGREWVVFDDVGLEDQATVKIFSYLQLIVELDFERGELDDLITVVSAVKGRTEFDEEED